METDSRQYFDAIAPEWDSLRATFFSESVREAAYCAAGVKAGELAADIGAGTGFITEGLVRRGLRVVAVDQSAQMLSELERKFSRERLLDCRVGTAENLPLKSTTMDYVFANMLLHHVESPPVAIQEMTRVLRPGGRLIITDLEEHGFEFLRVEQHDRWLGFNTVDVATWLKDARLRHVSVKSVGESCCARSCSSSESAKVAIFLGVGER